MHDVCEGGVRLSPMTDSLKWFDKNNAAVITGSGVLKGRTATSSFRSKM